MVTEPAPVSIVIPLILVSVLAPEMVTLLAVENSKVLMAKSAPNVVAKLPVLTVANVTADGAPGKMR